MVVLRRRRQSSPPELVGFRHPQCRGYLDLSFGDKLAFQVDGVISAEESERLIAFTEELGFRAAAPGIQTSFSMRQNTTVHWMVHPKDAETLYGRIASLSHPS